MQYNVLNGTGLVVSRMALGAMTFGDPGGPSHRLDQGAADALVGRALDAGINLFNTADVYSAGRSEEILGAALRGRRDQVIIATKVGFRTGEGLMDQGLSKRHILDAVEASLTRLGTDYIDLYLAHRVDPHTPLLETLVTLDQLVKDGKVRYIGFSNWPVWMAAKAIGLQRNYGLAPFIASESYYSLIGRDIEEEFIPFSLDSNIALTVWSPLAMGFLSGRYTGDDPSGPAMGRALWSPMHQDIEHCYRVLDTVTDIAQAHDTTASAVSLAWLLSKPAVGSILIGASSTDQLEQNLRSVTVKLSDQELHDLDSVSAKPPRYPTWAGIGADPKLSTALEGDRTDAPQKAL